MELYDIKLSSLNETHLTPQSMRPSSQFYCAPTFDQIVNDSGKHINNLCVANPSQSHGCSCQHKVSCHYGLQQEEGHGRDGGEEDGWRRRKEGGGGIGREYN